jgi:hypothetical protein
MSVELELRLRYFASIREALGRGEEALAPGRPRWPSCATS